MMRSNPVRCLRRLLRPGFVASGVALGVTVAPATLAAPISRSLEKIAASDGEFGDQFGSDVAIQDDVALVGAVFDDDLGENAGAVYVFRLIDGSWVETQKLTASDGQPNDAFGGHVAISGDAALIGAHLEDTGENDAGAAYVFRRAGDVWTEEEKLVPSDPGSSARFGLAVGLSGDLAVIGAAYDDQGGIDAGAAYFFQRTNGVWEQDKKFAGALRAQLGIAASLRGDLALVGAWREDTNHPRSGTVHVYRRVGAAWSEEQVLAPDDRQGDDAFGRSVHLGIDVVVIGAILEDERGQNAGAAYLFRSIDGTWIEEQKLTASDGAFADHFGQSVSVSGESALVGAPGNGPGAAYFFDRVGDEWIESARFIDCRGESNDHLGYSVAQSGDLAIIGAFVGDGPDTDDTGVAHVGTRDPCPIDLDGSSAVDFGDILAVLTAWGNEGGPEDLNCNDLVDFGDLLIVLGAWGPCA